MLFYVDYAADAAELRRIYYILIFQHGREMGGLRSVVTYLTGFIFCIFCLVQVGLVEASLS